jgi:hypothetical protein
MRKNVAQNVPVGGFGLKEDPEERSCISQAQRANCISI